ncbi:MAG: macro domain-containing protein [Candidatus Eremiobacteraeota bacterium]|nr:macro domain-containing protein [Candidatus Eremiobacteraeota bacterium]
MGEETKGALIELSTGRLEGSGREMIAYGINHTGQMIGATAQAVMVAAGVEVQDAAREQLSKTDRKLGTVVVTPSFGLESTGVKWIAHVVSTPKHTPESPGWLVPAMGRILDEALRLQVPAVALCALGTAGGIAHETAAQLLVDVVKARHIERKGGSFPQVVFCLPDARVHEAFARRLRR